MKMFKFAEAIQTKTALEARGMIGIKKFNSSRTSNFIHFVLDGAIAFN